MTTAAATWEQQQRNSRSNNNHNNNKEVNNISSNNIDNYNSYDNISKNENKKNNNNNNDNDGYHGLPGDRPYIIYKVPVQKNSCSQYHRWHCLLIMSQIIIHRKSHIMDGLTRYHVHLILSVTLNN